jgi:hypothetical protein
VTPANTAEDAPRNSPSSPRATSVIVEVAKFLDIIVASMFTFTVPTRGGNQDGPRVSLALTILSR